MPERYEREIDERLAEPGGHAAKAVLPRATWPGARRTPAAGTATLQVAAGPRRLLFTTSEWCLLASIVCGLVAAGIAYTSGSGNALTGALAILAVLALLMGMITFWRR